MTLKSEIWGEIEETGTMIGTQAFIRDDHPGFEPRNRWTVSN